MMRIIGYCALPALLVGLSACGGGGAVGSTPTPSPTPSPTPTPTPAPAPPSVVIAPAPTPTPTPTPTPGVTFNTAEYNRSSGLPYHNAITAYQAGASGAGITVGVVDTGLTDVNGEFAGRISAASRAFGSNANYQDVEGHGTAVAAVIAASRNNQRVMGMAWGANVMALRTDDQGDCDDDGCSHPTSAITNAIDHAWQNGARVINVSLGGGAAPNSLLQAVKRATAAGTIIVISAGNNEDGEAPLVAPDALAQSFADPAYSNGLVIIASSVNDNDTVSSFSAGVQGFESVSMAALGNRVLTFDHTGAAFLYSGTSFSAPQISGAAALLAQAFPNLTSKQIVELLLSSARDIGAPGNDARYGVGILDINAAFKPVGTITIAGSKVTLETTGPSSLSAPMGDATPAAISSVGLDRYQRAYQIDLTPAFVQRGVPRALAAALDVTQRQINVGTDALSASFSIQPADDRVAAADPLAFAQRDTERSRLSAGTLMARLSPSARLVLGLRTGIGAIERRLADQPNQSFLIAERGFEGNQVDMRARTAIAVSQQAARGLTITGGFESGEMNPPSDRRAFSDAAADRDTPYQSASITVDFVRHGFGLSLGATALNETSSALGARFSPNLGAQSARSLFARLGAQAELPGKVRLTANWQHGQTRAAAGGLLRDGGMLMSRSWSADLARRDLFARNDMIGLRVSQPLRVIASRFKVVLADAWDWEQQVATERSVALNLVPQGRQRDYELSYGRGIGPGWLGANLYLREQGGNIATMPDDLGMALRWSMGF